MAIFQKLASAIYNDVVSGLRGYHHNMSLSMEQLEDEIVDTRLSIIKEYSLKGVLPVRDLLLSLNCIPVDCQDLDKCKCNSKYIGKPQAHFQVPQILNDYGNQAIDYIGSTDKMQPFVWYTSPNAWSNYQRYRKRGKDKPFVYIDTTPNENQMYDGYIFNAPYIEEISIVAIFKDPRQLEQFSCCSSLQDDNFNFINNEIRKRLTESKIKYYRQMTAQILPNNQEYNAG